METNNQNCAEQKLQLMKLLIEMDCTTLEEMLQNLQPKLLFNKKLTQQQVNCLHPRACKALGKTSLQDFNIDFQSFNNLNLSFEHVIFHFIDRSTIDKENWGNSADFHEEIYYIIILCNQRDLRLINFDSASDYKAFFVDRNGICNNITLTNKIFAEMRTDFLNRIGRIIQNNTSINYITEYFAYTAKAVKDFRYNNKAAKIMFMKLLLSNADCVLDGTDIEANNSLKDPKNQNKMTACFSTDTDVDFYDIAQTWP